MHKWLSKVVRSLFFRSRMQSEIDKELQFHLEMETRKHIERGASPNEARRLAQLQFGGIDKFKEEGHDVRGARLLEALLQDVRYGVRVLLKNPGFSILALLTLALGIGANTAIFSVVDGVLLRSLPYTNDRQLAVIHQMAPLAGVDNLRFSPMEVADYQRENRTLSDLVEYHSMAFILLGGQEPERVQTGVVSANFFDFLGVKPVFGRTFRTGEDQIGAEPVLVLSYEYWREKLGGDPHIVGRTFRMNDRVHTVVGVLPPVPQYPDKNDVYMPVSSCPFRSSERVRTTRTARMVQVFCRLRPGVGVKQAQSDMARIAGSLEQAYPEAYPKKLGFSATLSPLREELTKSAQPTLFVLLGTAGLVLLLACANIANLTLARLIRRERELSIRAALGAGRGRLMRQLLTESTLLSLAGGILGIVLASACLQLLVSFVARFTTRAAEVRIDGVVLLFTLLISVMTGLLSGCLPALSCKFSPASMREGGTQSTIGKRAQRLRGLLLAGQVAVSFVLLIGAGLMLRSVIKLQEVNAGFDPEEVLAARLSLNFSKYTNNDQVREFYDSLLASLRETPGVHSAAASLTMPLDQQANPFTGTFTIEGRPTAKGDPELVTDFRVVTPDYFATIHLPLATGRLFTDHDTAKSPPVALINQTMARHRWPNEDPAGKRVSLDSGKTWNTIVGIVGDIKQYSLDKPPTDEFYLPFAQQPSAAWVLVRTASDPNSLVQLLRQAVRRIDPDQPVTNIQSLAEVRNNSYATPRLTAILLGIFGGLALVITVAGIVGVMALWVNQRSHEIGVRMALGATSQSVMQMVLRQGMTLVTIGLALGVAGALAVTHWMTTLLFAVQPSDPATFVGVAATLLIAAVVACLAPARRATAIDPMLALRAE